MFFELHQGLFENNRSNIGFILTHGDYLLGASDECSYIGKLDHFPKDPGKTSPKSLKLLLMEEILDHLKCIYNTL